MNLSVKYLPIVAVSAFLVDVCGGVAWFLVANVEKLIMTVQVRAL